MPVFGYLPLRPERRSGSVDEREREQESPAAKLVNRISWKIEMNELRDSSKKKEKAKEQKEAEVPVGD